MGHKTTGTHEECRVELRDREDDLKRTEVRARKDDKGRICIYVDGDSVRVVKVGRTCRESEK